MILSHRWMCNMLDATWCNRFYTATSKISLRNNHWVPSGNWQKMAKSCYNFQKWKPRFNVWQKIPWIRKSCWKNAALWPPNPPQCGCFQASRSSLTTLAAAAFASLLQHMHHGFGSRYMDGLLDGKVLALDSNGTKTKAATILVTWDCKGAHLYRVSLQKLRQLQWSATLRKRSQNCSFLMYCAHPKVTT